MRHLPLSRIKNHSARHLLLAAVFLLPLAGFCNEETTTTNAPTGQYVSTFDNAALGKFFLTLNTNGQYKIRAEDLTPAKNKTQQGTWKWDAQKQEFQLTPNTNSPSFSYEFRRLRVHRYLADTLQWIPLGRQNHKEGAIDYLQFKRQKE